MLTGAIGIIISSFLLCFYTIPILVKIANKFNIYDTPSHIKKHNRNITFLGGVALIMAFIIPISLFLPEEIEKPKYINSYLVIILIMFIHGIGDDFFNYEAKNKFVVQALLCSLLIYKAGFYLPVETMSREGFFHTWKPMDSGQLDSRKGTTFWESRVGRV
jgi:UDP-N-acetylmuramyl pentapeptide phosphotransferase/UDP-N-acetylglucosamine-1-phosphate transferase